MKYFSQDPTSKILDMIVTICEHEDVLFADALANPSRSGLAPCNGISLDGWKQEIAAFQAADSESKKRLLGELAMITCGHVYCSAIQLRKELGESTEKSLPHISLGATDILALRPRWTEEQAEAWLRANAQQIEEYLVDKGWQQLESLLDEKKTDDPSPLILVRCPQRHHQSKARSLLQ